jgi:hypothetical protein
MAWKEYGDGMHEVDSSPAGTRRCRNCKWWDKLDSTNTPGMDNQYGARSCTNERVGPKGVAFTDGAQDGEAYAGIFTGPDFGCIHWEAKDGN